MEISYDQTKNNQNIQERKLSFDRVWTLILSLQISPSITERITGKLEDVQSAYLMEDSTS